MLLLLMGFWKEPKMMKLVKSHHDTHSSLRIVRTRFPKPRVSAGNFVVSIVKWGLEAICGIFCVRIVFDQL